MARDSEYHHALPPLTSDYFAELPAGSELELLLLEYVPSGGGVIFPVLYVHRALEYRSPGQKDAVAHGQARLEHDQHLEGARILFSRMNQTATLRGLVLEGQVKLSGPRPNNSSKPTPRRGAA